MTTYIPSLGNFWMYETSDIQAKKMDNAPIVCFSLPHLGNNEKKKRSKDLLFRWQLEDTRKKNCSFAKVEIKVRPSDYKLRCSDRRNRAFSLT